MSNENWQNNMDKLAGLQGSESAAPPVPRSYDPPTAEVSSPQTAPVSYPDSGPLMQPASGTYFNVQPQNGMGTASLVLGIIGVIPFPITGFWCSLLGIIFGAKGRGRANRGVATNKVMATWGMWLGIVGMGVQFLLSLAIAFG